MNNTLAFVVGALVGAAIGAGITYYYVQKRCDEDVAEVREMYREKEKERKAASAPEEKPDPADLVKKYKEEEQYTNYNKVVEHITEEDIKEGLEAFEEYPVYIIDQSEFGEIEDYDQRGFTWYSDMVLVEDVTDEMIEDVGEHFPITFLSGEEDAVYIRNDINHTYYEVLIADEPYVTPKITSRRLDDVD